MKKFTEYKQLNLNAVAENVANFWKTNQTFKKSVETREGKPEYVFYEGPPSANGMPGIHHVMARALKDIFCRYQTQNGKQVFRKAGWDTHGLPVELGVEKELGITKEDIGKKITVEEYNQACRNAVMRYTDVWNDLTEKIGYWVDLDNPYITYEPKYMETVWWLLKQLYNKDLLYKGYTIQPYSPKAGTGLSSHELNQPGTYRDVSDTTVVAQFSVKNLSEKAESFLNKSYNDFENACKKLLGENVLTFPLDITLPESLEALTDFLNEKNVKLNGFLHAIAMDKTIRQKSVKPMLEVTADEFNDTMTVSAFSLISLSHALLKSKVLQNGSSIVTLSYIAAEKVSFFPYINMSIAKAALERLTIEMAYELGRDFGIRANCVRFSPYMGSKAGNATLKIEDVERANRISPLGNANPEDLAHEVVHLFRKDIRITGEIRHVDGGFHIMG